MEKQLTGKKILCQENNSIQLLTYFHYINKGLQQTSYFSNQFDVGPLLLQL